MLEVRSAHPEWDSARPYQVKRRQSGTPAMSNVKTFNLEPSPSQAHGNRPRRSTRLPQPPEPQAVKYTPTERVYHTLGPLRMADGRRSTKNATGAGRGLYWLVVMPETPSGDGVVAPRRSHLSHVLFRNRAARPPAFEASRSHWLDQPRNLTDESRHALGANGSSNRIEAAHATGGDHPASKGLARYHDLIRHRQATSPRIGAPASTAPQTLNTIRARQFIT